MEVAPFTVMSIYTYLIKLCHIPENQYHLNEERLLYCPKLDTDQQVLKNTTKLYWDVRAMMR